jgi:hypothetical protein
MATGAVCLDMVETYSVPHVHDGYIFQQGGAPSHFWILVAEFLSEQFTEVWIGWCGSISWPSLSSDLTLLDFLLWGYVRDMAGLRRRIVDAVASVTPEVLRNTWSEIKYRFDICHAVEGEGGTCRHLPTRRKHLVSFSLFTSNILHVSALGVKLLAFFIGCVRFGHPVHHRII